MPHIKTCMNHHDDNVGGNSDDGSDDEILMKALLTHTWVSKLGHHLFR